MAIIKTCSYCGELFHAGDGFVRYGNLVYCCASHAEADGYLSPDWCELDPFNPEDKIEYADIEACIKVAEALYLEMRSNISNGPAKRTLERLRDKEYWP
jgi:hypothetical protein